MPFENAQRSTDLPRTIPAGKEFKFWIFGHPVPGPFNVSFKPLSRNGSAPIKPTVSQDGLLTWTPPSGLRGEFYLDDGYKKRQLAVVERSVGGVVENDPAGSTSTPKLTSIKFPELIEDVVVGGSGRYAILFIRKMKRLAIFDFQTRKVIKQLTLPSEDIAYAAGARKLFIHFRDKSVIQRWNLTTLERELTQTLNMEQSVLTMGSASEGPLLVSGRAHSRFLDPKTLQKANYQWPGHMHVSFSPSTQVRASANGQVFTAWRSGTSPTGLSALKISGNKLTQSYQHQSVGYVVPSPDGQVLYTAAGTFTNETNRIGSLQKSLAPLPVPSIRGHFVVKFPRADPTKRGPQLGPMTSGTLHLQGETSPLLTFHGLPNPVIGNERFSKGKLTLEQRFLFNPTEGLMVTVGATQLHLYSFDLEQALRGSGKDFLFVSSQAPSSVTLGSQFNYQIEAHSKEAVSYKLDSYPKGMTITKQGKLIWPVSNVSEGETESVVVVVKSASGKEIFHVFDLRIESGDTQLASNAKPKPSEPPTPSEETPPESDSDSEVMEPEIPAGSLEILPARLRTESVKFKLPASIDSACVGARGRYIFLLMSSLNKLAVFDTSRARIVKYLPVDGRKTFFAAGREKLIMVSDSKRIISRWNLRNFERELAVPLKVSGPLRDIVMGSDSQGPLLIGETNRYDSVMHMMDIKTMRMINIEGKGRIRLRTLWRMAADGSVIGTWSVGLSPSGLQTILLNGNRMRGFSEHTSVGHIVPGPDGRYVYTGTGVYTNQLKPLSSDTKMRKPTIPSIHGDYYLGVVMNRNARKPEGVNLEVYQAGDTRLLHTIKGIPALSGRIFNRGNRTIGFDKRVMYIPDAELLVVIPHTNDHLYLLHFDLFESLDQSGVDYLFVTSRSPSTAVSGGEYRYKIAVRSKQGDVRLKLESAPEGMELDGDELLWDVPDQVDDANPIILISVGDSSGQEIFHKIELKVIGAEEAATIASTPSTPKPPLPTSPKRTSPPSTSPGPFAPRQRKAKDQPVRVAENRLEIPDGEFSLVTGHENKSLLLLQGKRITTLGPEGHTIHRTAELPEAFSHLEDRQGYYVGVNDARVSLIDKGTLQQIRTMPLSGTKVQDMVLHPRRPITYIARTTKDQPIPHFLVFDELTGKARQSKDYSGNQLAIGARGKMLLTRMRVNFKDLPIKLQQGFVIKNAITYRTFLYRLGRGGEPYVLDHSTRHSWSSRVWELSSDGKRLAESRSGVGYVFSNPTDLKELPVTFETGGFRGRSNLDFHPVFSWAACLTQDGPVLVNPETATMISDRLPADLSKQIGGASVRSLRFSPDGKRLLVHLRTGHIDDLLSLALRLEKEEVSALQNHFESLDKSTETSKPKRVVPLREFESLAGGIGGDLLPKDISQASSDSIVVVRQGEESSGTGFVIGSDGYIFTCAHCVDGTEKPSVSYRVKQKDDKVIVKSSPASIIHRDYERDLALLKIEVEKPLPPVRLGFISKMTSGEQVTVIANPGVGRTILDHTITTGVVSNPKRTFQGLDFIQTSAAVNPGSSGGALFNSQGFVCGMVVLKASIEGAGFAIPSSDLVEFVLSVSDFSGENTQLVREWLDSTGQRSVKAKFIRLEEDSVTISRVDDNREFSLKREALHQQDQSFIRLLEMNASVQRK